MSRRRNPLLLTLHNPTTPPPVAETWWQLGDRTIAVVKRAPSIGGRHFFEVSRLSPPEWKVPPQHHTLPWDPRRGMTGRAALKEQLERRWGGGIEPMDKAAVQALLAGWKRRSNPYWLAGKVGRFTVEAKAGQDRTEKDIELAMHPGGHVEHETDAAAKVRRRVDKRLAKATSKQVRKPESAGQWIAKRGGIDTGPTFVSWPFARGFDVLKTRVGILPLFRKSTAKRRAIRWDDLAVRLKEAGYLADADDRTALESLIDRTLAGESVYAIDGTADDWAAQEQRRADHRAHRAQRRANPSPSPAAVAAYEAFHEVAPRKVRSVNVPGSGDLVALGDLVEIVYRPTRGARRGPAFVHKFGAGAVVAASPDGTELVLVPGRRPFRVDWRRGIIG